MAESIITNSLALNLQVSYCSLSQQLLKLEVVTLYGNGYVKEKELCLDCLVESFYSFTVSFSHCNQLTLEESMLLMVESLLYLQLYGEFL